VARQAELVVVLDVVVCAIEQNTRDGGTGDNDRRKDGEDERWRLTDALMDGSC
jgi:hypothetical protein